MATTYIENIDNLRPDSWTKNTAADGPTLTNSFLNPTHEKDQILARGIDTINSKLSTYDTKISNVNTRLDTVNENIDLVNADIADVENKLDEIEHETSAKLEKVYVNEQQLSGDGTQNNPIGIINGGGGGGPVPTIVGNMGVSAAYVSENNQYVIGLSGTKNLVFESSADTIVFASSAAGKYNFEVNPELVNKWNAGTSAFTNNGFSGIGTSSSRIGVDETGMSTSYKYGWNPQLHKWSEINEGGGTGTTYDFDNGTNGTLSGNGHDNPIGVNTDVLATKNWVSEQQYIANITKDTTYLSGDGTSNSPLGIQNTYTEHWNDAYNVTEEYKTASARYDAHSALSATKLDKTIWDNNSGKFVTSAETDFQTNGQYGIIKDNNGIHWGEIQGGYDIIGNNGISAKKDTTNARYEVGLSAKYISAVSADTSLSGNGATSALGINMTNAYTIDGTNGITAVPDATTNKVVVQMTNDVYQDVQHLHTSASEWDKISGLSAKSNVNITSAGVTTVTNTSGTTVNKFTQYAEVASHPTPRMFLCATADSVADITGVLTAASGMGAVVFVIESHS